MIISFRNRGTADVYYCVNSNEARRVCPPVIWSVARRKLDLLNAAEELQDLATPSGNDLHRLKKERRGQYAIRINDQYRICFWWTEEGAEDVEITDYH